MKLARLKMLVLGSALATLWSGNAPAQISNADLITQAKKEGRVTWYTTVSIPESKH